MAILFANGVSMTLAADLAADATEFDVTAGQGSQCPEIATDSTDHMLLCITNKNGVREIAKIIEHELDSDTFTIGDDTSVPHSASTDGRAYEATFDGYQTALAITAADTHKITMPVTATTLQSALAFAATTSTVEEVDTLHDSGITNADLVKLHAMTLSAAEANTLHSSGITNADLVKVHGITPSAALINSGIDLLNPTNRAIGDLITETSAGTMGAIAAVAATQYLKSAGVATLPAYGKLALSDTGIKIGTFQVSTSDVTIDDVGFEPSVVIFLHGGVGFDDGTTHIWSSEASITTSGSVNFSGKFGYISSKNSSGYVFHITSALSGTSNVGYLAFP